MTDTIKESLNDDQLTFVSDIASLLATTGMPQTSARIYGYLLLNCEPVGLDDMTRQLEISKSAASVAVKHLEGRVMARRHSVPGTKRVLFTAPEHAVGLLSSKSLLIKEMGNLLTHRASTIASGRTQKRIQAIGQFYLSMQNALENLLIELNKTN